MSLLMSDEDIALFASLPRSALTDIVELASRAGPDFFSDTLAMLKLAEKLNLPGALQQTLHHDARGRVGRVEHEPSWHRQAKGRKAS